MQNAGGHYEYRTIKAVIAYLFIVLPLSASAATLGPRAEDPPARDKVQTALTAAPFRLAIPLLDPGIPASAEDQFKRRIWPELRNAEAARIAIKLKQAIDQRGTFRDVVVAPDTSVSADFYLLARIEASNGEDLTLRWHLLDATQRLQIQARTDTYRVWDGWHAVNDAAQSDPFSWLYEGMAGRIHRKMSDLAKTHQRQLERNERLVAQGRQPKLSPLDRIAATRSLVFAKYFAPDLYGDAVTEANGRLRLEYLPAQDGDDWARIESIKARDERFAALMSQQYAGLTAQMHKSYSDWQKDNFPLAREARLARRDATWSAVAGTLGAVGAVAAAADESNPHSEAKSAVLAAASAAAIARSIAKRGEASALHAQINEIGASVQGALKPMVVQAQERTVTLSGTAREQFLQWRALLRELYQNTGMDIEAVQFANNEEG